MRMNKNISSNDNTFLTTDLHLASVLLSIGYPLRGIDRSKPKKAIFVFTRNDRLEEIIKAFWARGLKLEPLSVLTSLKLMKNRLYSQDL